MGNHIQNCNCCKTADCTPLFKSYVYTLVRCNSCNLHFVDPMPDESSRMKDVHEGRFGDDQKVIAADGQYEAEQTMEVIFQGYLDRIQRYVPDGHLLDVGCGAGFFMVLAQRAGFHTTGIELTADRLAKSRATTGSVIHDKPVEQLDLPEGSFDAITLVNVFSHLADPLRTLTTLSKLLRPGGVLLVVTGEISGAPVRPEHLPEWTLGDELFFLGEGTMARYAEAMGLEVASVDKRWLPDALYSRERFRVMGRSPIRNAAKRFFLVAPGALPLLHWAMSKRQADNPIHSAVFVLRRPA